MQFRVIIGYKVEETKAKFRCLCGNAVSFEHGQCEECFGESIRESDGYSHRSGRKDCSDTWCGRLEDGFGMLNDAEM